MPDLKGTLARMGTSPPAYGDGEGVIERSVSDPGDTNRRGRSAAGGDAALAEPGGELFAPTSVMGTWIGCDALGRAGSERRVSGSYTTSCCDAWSTKGQ
jgi:hypothetical protein